MGPGGFFSHQSPLAMAAKSGSVATVSALLKAGADPNSSSTVLGGGVVSYSALGDAAANGHTQAVEALLACGPSPRSGSPLYRGIFRVKPESVLLGSQCGGRSELRIPVRAVRTLQQLHAARRRCQRARFRGLLP